MKNNKYIFFPIKFIISMLREVYCAVINYKNTNTESHAIALFLSLALGHLYVKLKIYINYSLT